MKFKICLILVAIAGVFNSCSVPNAIPKETKVDLPESYATSLDSLGSSFVVNWKDYFQDPYLTELIDTALVNNKEMNILMQRIQRSKNEISARTGEYLPSIAAGFRSDIEKVGKYTRAGAVEEGLEIREGKENPEFLGNLELGLFASWEVDIWKKLRNAKKASVLEYMASMEGKNFLTTNLIAEIANSYYELLALDYQMKNLNQNLEIQQNALDVVKLLQQAGRVNSLAIKRFEAEVQKNKSERFIINQEIVQVENTINFLLGRGPQPIARDTSDFIEMQPVFMDQTVPSELLDNRPDIRKAEYELAAARINIDVARTNFYPTLDIKAGIGFQAFKPKFLLNTPESILFSLAGDVVAPLVNRRAIEAEFYNANAMQIERAYEYEQTVLNAYIEVANLLSNVENLNASFDLKMNQVDALTESIEISNQLFQSARIEYLEVLLTQREALEARSDLINIRKEQFLTSINIYKALGGGWQS